MKETETTRWGCRGRFRDSGRSKETAEGERDILAVERV